MEVNELIRAQFRLLFVASSEKEMATHSSILAWRIPWTEEPGRRQSTGSQRVDTTERLLFTSSRVRELQPVTELEKAPQWKARALQLESSLHSLQVEKSPCCKKAQSSPKKRPTPGPRLGFLVLTFYTLYIKGLSVRRCFSSVIIRGYCLNLNPSHAIYHWGILNKLLNF